MAIPCFDRDQFDFEQFVKKKMNLPTDRILSAEWCFCGRGIPLLYEFLSLKEGKTLEKQFTGEEIFANIDTDPLAKRTFERFLQMLGALLMCNCSALLPDDGLVLCGNIINSLLDKILEDMKDRKTSHFYKGFLSSPCIDPYMETIPLFFTKDTELNIKGCLVAKVYD